MRLADRQSAILEVSHKAYENMVIFYPEELRGDFASEMIEVFDEQVSEAYSRQGPWGLLRAWFSALWEMVTVALPGRLARHGIPIIGVTVTLAFMLWFANYISSVMQTACSSCSMN